uniref:Regulatory protein zeste n=1 Tax=Timema monikensis TaxID=170555 RepID=A0A7R9HUZ9_9NEOP|nr:unnamed protein product [Timema monikensis]
MNSQGVSRHRRNEQPGIFATGKLIGPQGSINATQQWTELTQQLKELGPGKSTEQWKKVWRDLKRNTRDRAAAFNAAHRQAGNLNVEDKLSELDKKVIAVVGRDLVLASQVFPLLDWVQILHPAAADPQARWPQPI